MKKTPCGERPGQHDQVDASQKAKPWPMEPCLMKESFEDYTRVLNEYCRSSRLGRKQLIEVLREEPATPMSARTLPCSTPCGWSQDGPVANAYTSL